MTYPTTDPEPHAHLPARRRCVMTQLSGAFTVELDTGRLVEQIATRVVELLTEHGYQRDQDPGQATADPHRGQHPDQDLGLDGLP